MRKQITYFVPLLLIVVSVSIGSAQESGENYNQSYFVDVPVIYDYLSLNETINYQTPADILDSIYLIEGKKGDRLFIWASTNASAHFIPMDTQGLIYLLRGNISEGDSIENHVLQRNTTLNATQYSMSVTFPQDAYLCLLVLPAYWNVPMGGYIQATRISHFGIDANVTRGSSLADRIRYKKALDYRMENVSMVDAPV